MNEPDRWPWYVLALGFLILFALWDIAATLGKLYSHGIHVWH